MRECTPGNHLYIRGCNSNMAVTAQNESWKPTSNSQTGRQRSIKKATAESVFKEKFFRRLSPDKANKENINTERTTEADSPVKKANPQRNAMINKVRNTAIARQRPGNHRRQNQSNAYKKPICKPDNAST